MRALVFVRLLSQPRFFRFGRSYGPAPHVEGLGPQLRRGLVSDQVSCEFDQIVKAGITKGVARRAGRAGAAGEVRAVGLWAVMELKTRTNVAMVSVP